MSSESAITAAETPAANGHGEAHSTATFKALMLGSIGVVYGDIGTSPLYALREAVVAAAGGEGGVTIHAVLGVVSLILWALVVVVTLKYVVILLRADNNGEGGTLALMARNNTKILYTRYGDDRMASDLGRQRKLRRALRTLRMALRQRPRRP